MARYLKPIDATAIKYSVVIPVYRSEDVVGRTIDRVIVFFTSKRWDFEIVLVNDHSPDSSWDVIRSRAENDSRIIAINLLKNYGQHTANVVGFQYISGDCVITLDDDLQNPPEEIEKLAAKFAEGYDLVVGVFESKKHSFYRRVGSEMMQLINRHAFNAPPSFRHSNFRAISRAVIDRINSYKNHYPYTSGMAVMFSRSPANVIVRHDKRETGQSSYNLRKLIGLAWTIIYNYSNIPTKISIGLGMAVSVFSLAVASFLVLRTILMGTSGTGWTSLMLVISVSNSILFIVLALLAKQLSIITAQLRMERHFFVGEVVRSDA